MRSPTQKSLKFFREAGFKVDVVEHWVPFVKRRKDLFGFIDIVAVSRLFPVTFGVQTTSYENVASRVKKIRGLPESTEWLDSKNVVIVQGWKLNKSRRLESRNLVILPGSVWGTSSTHEMRLVGMDGSTFIRWLKEIIH